MTDLLPLFVSLAGRRVVLVGGGPVAAGKLMQLVAAGADVIVVSPDVHPDIARSGLSIERRPFRHPLYAPSAIGRMHATDDSISKAETRCSFTHARKIPSSHVPVVR